MKSNDPDFYGRVFARFRAWLEASPEGREELIAAAREEDADLHAALLGVIDNQADAHPLLQTGGGLLLGDSPVPEDGAPGDNGVLHMPESIGPYRVRERIGSGGMGTVYAAEQESPRRTVALKVIHPGLARGAGLRRFRREADALARLQHPCIAQIFDVDTCQLDHGEQPFLVMEHVEGAPLTVHVQRLGLDREAKLELFAQLCDAIHYAHTRGVLHRDIKPDNVLVSSLGGIKVLDFGIARWLRPDHEVDSLETEGTVVVGTLSHMAPEQVGGGRSQAGSEVDVYSLGVVLYELLTGRLPKEFGDRDLAAALLHVSSGESTPIVTYDRSLRGDLEAIVEKAIHPTPQARYGSAAALASDVRRHLRHEPIRARRLGWLGRGRRLSRRHPGLVTTIAVLLAGLLTSGWLLRRTVRVSRAAVDARLDTRRALYRSKMLLAQESFSRPEDSEALARFLDPWRPENRLPGEPDLRGWEWWLCESRLQGARGGNRTERLPWDGMALARSPTGSGFALTHLKSAVLADVQGQVTHVSDGLGYLVSKAVWASDGSAAYFVESERAGPLRIRRLGSQEVLAEWPVSEVVSELALSPDRQHVAIGSTNRVLRVLDAATGAVRWERVKGSDDNLEGLAFSPDSTLLAAGASPTGLALLDPLSGEQVGFAGTPGQILSVVWSPDGGRLATWDSHEVVVRSVPGMDVLAKLSGRGRLAWSADGERIAIADGYRLRVVDWRTGRLVMEAVSQGDWPVDPVFLDGSMDVARADGHRWRGDGALSTRYGWVGGGGDGGAHYNPMSVGGWSWAAAGDALALWRTGDPLPQGHHRLEGTNPGLSCTGKYLAYLNKGRFYVRRTQDLGLVADHALPANGPLRFHWHPRHESVLVVTSNLRVTFALDVESGRVPAEYPVETGHRFVWHPDGRRGFYTLQTEIRSTPPLLTSEGEIVEPADFGDTRLHVAWGKNLRLLSISPCGEWLTVESKAGVTLLRVADGSVAAEWPNRGGAALFAWHPSSSRLAIADWEGRVVLVDPATGESTFTLHDGDAVRSMGWDTAGNSLLARTTSGQILEWRVTVSGSGG